MLNGYPDATIKNCGQEVLARPWRKAELVPSSPENPPASVNNESQVLELLDGIKKQDTAALGKIYDIYAGRVFAILLRSVESGLAEELLQDIFLALWQKAGLYDSTRGNFNAWFFTLVRHRLYDALPRYNKIRQITPFSTPSLEPKIAGLPVSEPGPEEEALTFFRNSEIKGVLAGLPPEQREVIIQTFFGGLTQKELADRLNLPLSTIKGRSRLGLQKLRNLLEESEIRPA